MRDLRALGYRVSVDLDRVDKISRDLVTIAEIEGKPLGAPVEYNGLHYMHQTPGGMLANFRSQLETAGLSDRYDDLLLEVAWVRNELAYPIMITPFAQFVGVQGVMNVISGDRYSVVPNEIKKYALGYFGELLAEIDPEILERIIANGSSAIALEPPSVIPSMLEGLKAQYPDEDIDAILLRAMFAGSQVDDMKATVAAGGNPDEIPRLILGLIESLYASSGTGRHTLNAGDLHISIEKGASDAA